MRAELLGLFRELESAGLVDAFEDLAGQLAATAGLKVALSFEGLGHGQRLDPELELAAYRIAQESLNNVLKYAGVDEAGVLLARRDPLLLVSIWDEGAGFTPDQASPEKVSTGILGMKARAAQLGGRLRVRSLPGEGTTILAELPIDKNSRASMQPKEEDSRYAEDIDRR